MVVRLYETPSCGLCEEALAALERLRRTRRFVIERVDAHADDRYVLRVPVLVMDGEELEAAGMADGAIARWLDEVAPPTMTP